MNYFITALTRGPINKDWRSRTFGYFNTQTQAVEAVEKNIGSMQECLYSWIVIEPVPPGIYGFLQNDLDKDETIWYKWVRPENEDGHWEKCERPEEYKHFCSFFA